MSNFDCAQTSLKKECYLLSAILITFIFGLSLIVYISIYIYNEKAKKHLYISESELIETSLNEDVNYLLHYMKFIGKKIVDNKDAGIDYIASLISNRLPNNILNNDFSSWTLFDWVDSKNFLVANSLHGRFKEPINMFNRKHLENAPLKPWELQFSDPVIGIPSGQLVIPIGMGIANNEQFYGTLATGLDLSKLNNKVNNIADKNQIDFLIIDNNHNIIAHSPDLKIPIKNLKTNIEENSFFSKDNSGFFANNILLNGTEFIYYKKLSLYPYYLILGKNRSIINKELFESIVPRIIELSFLGTFAICLLFYFRYKIIGPISQLAGAASKIANEKNQQNIDYTKYTELNILVERLNEIQSLKLQLIHSKEIIEQANESLEHKVI
ncbi:MAG: cache domain-containing protein, partial [Alphaproteobacteria bacterium]